MGAKPLLSISMSSSALPSPPKGKRAVRNDAQLVVHALHLSTLPAQNEKRPRHENQARHKGSGRKRHQAFTRGRQARLALAQSARTFAHATQLLRRQARLGRLPLNHPLAAMSCPLFGLSGSNARKDAPATPNLTSQSARKHTK